MIAAGADSAAARAPAEHFDLVIAADGGLDLAERLGIDVHEVVGDLDSATPGGLARARDLGVGVRAHPTEKDQTDLELAIQRALREQPDQIHVLGAAGGRPDHWLANLLLLAAAAESGSTIDAEMDGWTVSAVVPPSPFAAEAAPGQLISLVPVGGDAIGVTTQGLEYSLDGEVLTHGSARGVSNVASGGPVRVQLDAGTLLLFRQITVRPLDTNPQGAL